MKYSQKNFIDLLFTPDEINNGSVVRYREMIKRKDINEYVKEKNGFTFTPNPVNIFDNALAADMKIYPEITKDIFIEEYPHLKVYTGNVKNSHLKLCRTFFIEFDDGSLEEQKDFIKQKIKELNFPKPSAVVFSGKKSYHTFFTLDFDFDGYDKEEWKLIQSFLINKFSENGYLTADKSIQNPAHKMRLGGVNDGERNQSILFLGNRIKHSDFQIALDDNGFQKFKQSKPKPGNDHMFDVMALNISDKAKNKYIEREVENIYFRNKMYISKGNRNNLLFKTVVKGYKALLSGHIPSEKLSMLNAEFIKECRKFGDFPDFEIIRTLDSAKQAAASDLEDWLKESK